MRTDGWFSDGARSEGKSQRTRARLMDAAVKLFARDGFEAASVNEIAKVADVANGTFYVHFRDKDEIAAAVAFEMARQIVRQLDEAMADLTDAVDRVSTATRRFIDLAASQGDWGKAFFRAVWVFPDLRGGVADYLKADLELGERQGAFTTPIDAAVINSCAAMVMGALFSRLEGGAGADAGSRVAELQLRMLGVAPDRARVAAWREIAPLSLQVSAKA